MKASELISKSINGNLMLGFQNGLHIKSPSHGTDEANLHSESIPGGRTVNDFEALDTYPHFLGTTAK